MKKSLIVMASLILGGVALTAAPNNAKLSREMKQYGPVAVVTANTYAVNGLEVLDLDDATGEVILYKALPLRTGKDSQKTTIAKVALPGGFAEKGSDTTWAWGDAGLSADIVGFKGKTIFLELKIAGNTRIYAYQLNKTASKIKVLGSTSNIGN